METRYLKTITFLVSVTQNPGFKVSGQLVRPIYQRSWYLSKIQWLASILRHMSRNIWNSDAHTECHILIGIEVTVPTWDLTMPILQWYYCFLYCHLSHEQVQNITSIYRLNLVAGILATPLKEDVIRVLKGDSFKVCNVANCSKIISYVDVRLWIVLPTIPRFPVGIQLDIECPFHLYCR